MLLAKPRITPIARVKKENTYNGSKKKM